MDNTFDFAAADFADSSDAFSLSDAITPPATDELFFGTETVFRGIALDSAPVVDLSTPFDFAAVSRDLDVAAAAPGPAVPPPLPCQPYFLSSTTLESDSSPSLLFTSLATELTSRNVDFTTNMTKFKIKGSHTHSDGTQCLLVARVWSRPSSDGLLVVEMQRRRGSAAVFRSLFNAIRAALAEEGVVMEDSSSSSASAVVAAPTVRGFAALPVPAALCASLPPITVTADSVSPLTTNLMSSQHPSIQRDAAATLASLASTSSDDTLAVIAPVSVKALASTLATPDHELNSCSATATATILASAAARSALSPEEIRLVTLALLDSFTSTAAQAAKSSTTTTSTPVDIFPSSFLGDGEFVTLPAASPSSASASDKHLDVPMQALASLRQAALALVSVVQDSEAVQALTGAIPASSLDALRIAAGCEDSALSTAASTAMRTLVTV